MGRKLEDHSAKELRRMLKKPVLSVEEARSRLIVLREYVTIMGEHYGEGTNRRYSTSRHYISEIAQILEGTAHQEVAKMMATYIGTDHEVRLSTAVLTAWIYNLKQPSGAIYATFRRLDGGAAAGETTLPANQKGVKLDSMGRPCNRAGIPFVV